MTNSKWFSNSDPDPIGDLMRRINALETYANDVERKFANLDSPHPVARVDPVSYMNPYEGQRAIDPADEQHMWYSNGEWRKAGIGIYEVKYFADEEEVVVPDEPFEWMIPPDLDSKAVKEVYAFVSTVSSGNITLMLVNEPEAGGGDVNILSSNLTIGSGDLNSDIVNGDSTVNTSNATVLAGDHLRMDVVGPGSGAKGLGFIVVIK